MDRKKNKRDNNKGFYSPYRCVGNYRDYTRNYIMAGVKGKRSCTIVSYILCCQMNYKSEIWGLNFIFLRINFNGVWK